MKQALLRNKLLYFKKFAEASKENKLWREASIVAFADLAKENGGAQRLLATILRKAGIRPSRTLDDLEEEELIEAIEDARVALKLSNQ